MFEHDHEHLQTMKNFVIDHGNLQQMSGQLQSEEQQAETVQHVIVFLLNSFVNGTESLTDVYVDEVLDLLYSLCTQGDNRRILLNRFI